MEGMAEVRRRLLAEGIETPLASTLRSPAEDLPEAVRRDAPNHSLRSSLLGWHAAIRHLAKLCQTLGSGFPCIPTTTSAFP